MTTAYSNEHCNNARSYKKTRRSAVFRRKFINMCQINKIKYLNHINVCPAVALTANNNKIESAVLKQLFRLAYLMHRWRIATTVLKIDLGLNNAISCCCNIHNIQMSTNSCLVAQLFAGQVCVMWKYIGACQVRFTVTATSNVTLPAARSYIHWH